MGLSLPVCPVSHCRCRQTPLSFKRTADSRHRRVDSISSRFSRVPEASRLQSRENEKCFLASWTRLLAHRLLRRLIAAHCCIGTIRSAFRSRQRPLRALRRTRGTAPHSVDSLKETYAYAWGTVRWRHESYSRRPAPPTRFSIHSSTASRHRPEDLVTCT